MRFAADAALNDLELRRANPLPDERGIGTQGFDEGVLRSLDGFFESRLGYRAGVACLDLEAYRLRRAVEYKRAEAMREIVDNIVKRVPPLC